MEGFTEFDLKYILDILDSLKKNNELHNDNDDDCECDCCEHTGNGEEHISDFVCEPTMNLHIDNINFTFNFWSKDCDE